MLFVVEDFLPTLFFETFAPAFDFGDLVAALVTEPSFDMLFLVDAFFPALVVEDFFPTCEVAFFGVFLEFAFGTLLVLDFLLIFEVELIIEAVLASFLNFFFLFDVSLISDCILVDFFMDFFVDS